MAIRLVITGVDDGDVIYENGWDATESVWCGSCDEAHHGVVDDYEAGYECGQCGTTFLRSDSADGDSARCPSCGKFSAKVLEHACPDCQAEELTTVMIYPCPKCGDVMPEAALPDHLTTCFD